MGEPFYSTAKSNMEREACGSGGSDKAKSTLGTGRVLENGVSVNKGHNRKTADKEMS